MKFSALAAAIAVAFSGLAVSRVEAGCVLQPLAELPVTMNASRQPRISATINGTPVSFLVDSGAFFSSLSSTQAAALKLRLTPTGDENYVIGVGGVADLGETRVSSFGLPGNMLHNVAFAVVGRDVANLIGQNVLGLADTEYTSPLGWFA